MSFVVESYNIDSGWLAGKLLTHAATETEALAEAAEKLGVTGLTNFRHIATEVAETVTETAEAAVTTPATEPDPASEPEKVPVTPEPVPPVVEAPHDVVTEVTDLLKHIDKDTLLKAFSRLLGG